MNDTIYTIIEHIPGVEKWRENVLSKDNRELGDKIKKGIGGSMLVLSGATGYNTYRTNEEIKKSYDTLKKNLDSSHHQKIVNNGDLQSVFQETIESQKDAFENGELSYLEQKIEASEHTQKITVKKEIQKSKEELTNLNSVTGYSLSLTFLALGVWSLYENK